MRASVIVPVYNGAHLVNRCLDALANQTWQHSEYEIIVVDDGSTDNTVEAVKKWKAQHPTVRVELICQENAGPATARNAGADVANTALLLFTDADCAPQPDWLEQMAAAFDQADVVGAKGAYLSDQTGLVPRFVQAEYEDRYDRMRAYMREKGRIDFIDTYSAGYRSDIFLKSGGFDAVFSTASVEDQEFSFRLAEQGYRLTFQPEARVLHLHDENLAEYARRKFYIGYWKALVTRRYPQRVVNDSHTPQVLKAQILIVAGLLPLTALSALAIWRPRLRRAWALLATGAGLFTLFSAPFLAKLARHSWKLSITGLPLLLVRAIALGSGYLAGMIRFRSS